MTAQGCWNELGEYIRVDYTKGSAVQLINNLYYERTL